MAPSTSLNSMLPGGSLSYTRELIPDSTRFNGSSPMLLKWSGSESPRDAEGPGKTSLGGPA